jgi:hypothetical protein
VIGKRRSPGGIAKALGLDDGLAYRKAAIVKGQALGDATRCHDKLMLLSEWQPQGFMPWGWVVLVPSYELMICDGSDDNTGCEKDSSQPS